MESNVSASLRKALSRADLYKDAINSSEELNEDMGGVAVSACIAETRFLQRYSV